MMHAKMLQQLLLSSVIGAYGQSTSDFTQYVLTSMGESNGGNDFPGVAVPFGMVKLGYSHPLCKPERSY